MSRHNEELRTYSPSQLLVKLQESQDELSTLTFQLANRQSSNTARIGTIHREIARIKTLLREDQLRRTS